MSKRKAVTITVCICTGLFLLIDAVLFSYLHYTEQQTKLAQESGLVSEEWYPNEIVWMGVAGDGVSTCVVENVLDHCMMILPGESVFLVRREGEKKSKYTTAYSTYLLKEYRIEDGMPGRTIDLARISEVYPNYFINDINALWEIDGEYYVEVLMAINFDEGETIEDYMRRENPWKYIYVNLNTGVMFEGTMNQFKDIMMVDTFYLFSSNHDFLTDNISENYEEQLWSPYSITTFNAAVPSGCFSLSLDSIDLPQENEELYSLFPELQKYIGKPGYYIHLIIGNNPDAEYLLRLLMEDGQAISFENFKPISPNESIDGEEHIVNSFEEYYQWKDIKLRTSIWD